MCGGLRSWACHVPSSVPPAAQRWHVLIADDNPDDRAEARRLLLSGSARQYVISETETGQETVQFLSGAGEGQVACVILDFHLPDSDAPQILAQLAGVDGSQSCPVVVVTGSDDDVLGRAALRAGAQDFIGKAWLTPRSLTRALENAIARWELARELRASEARAAEQADRLRLALQSSNTGIWTWDLASDSVDWSAEARAIFGVSASAEALTSDSFFQLVHPEDREKVGHAVYGAIHGPGSFKSEFRIVRPSGEVIWAQDLGRVTYAENGEAVSLLGTVTDISERKRAEATLQARERELQTLADNTPYIIVRFDREHRHVFINAEIERATGRPRSEFLGKTNRELGLPLHLCELWESAIDGVFSSAQSCTIEFDFETTELRHFGSRLIPELCADGLVTHVLAIAEDVTEQKQQEATLRAALQDAEAAIRARDRLASLVSHDLKTPLNNLTLAVSLLTVGDGASAAQIVPKMSRQIRTMSLMVEELLDLAQLQAGKAIDLQLQAVDLVLLVTSLVEEHQLVSKRHRIQLETASASIVGTWDRRRLERVVNNFLSNAIKYSPKGGLVRVELSLEEPAHACLRVTDSGIGIAPHEQANIFRWYSRAENARNSPIHGHGIGLAGAHDIVVQHGGSISIESAEGQGSTFTVRLPLSQGGV